MGSVNDTSLCVGKTPWWKEAVFYQVYPASFKDTNNDGWGDIPGLIAKIDYLHDLGVDCVWLSPMFESPQKDMGYDISDYQAVFSRYGTLSDVDYLISACHTRGMKLILDLVVNHTSDQHPWFQESRSSKTNPKRDWYMWKPARYDANGNRMPPTNWRSYFAGPTWTWDEHTQEYYLHLYDTSQPDLNWENPECRKAIYDEAMRFWLDRGVDGFRIDTVNKYSKRVDFPDAPVTMPGETDQPAPEMWCNGPRIHEFIREMNEQVLAPYNAVSVGELSNTPLPEQVLPYVSAAAKELDMVFEFSTIRLGTGGPFHGKYLYREFPLSELKQYVATWQQWLEGTDGWHTVFCENHDNGRAVSRFGDDSTAEAWEASAKTIALWQATLTGTIFLYQGQEIGMVNMPKDWPIEAEYKDVESLNFYKEAKASGDVERIRKTEEGLRILARDHSRIPMQWDASPNSGFTKEYSGLFVHGAFRPVLQEDETLFVYVKDDQGFEEGDVQAEKRRKALVVMNFSGKPANLQEHNLDVAATPGCKHGEERLLVTTLRKKDMSSMEAGTLRPWESRVYLSF
ncbi:unnamed protein product [Sordaria macrospora k-hell]|uniref:Alpha-glucosidase n=1 Tax=Sordaria macrospora (strain ATCC MYA-333 / DSM 997 / K(L3346) / K-hell) TaxID=771870 RepID=F7VUA3_SORMK|nr:uncharacterized protein SMAC_03080 [Sordaria macrospora k-hell]CCC09091.1 unnamed protein product [Sordaria macrospora k-hell]